MRYSNGRADHYPKGRQCELRQQGTSDFGKLGVRSFTLRCKLDRNIEYSDCEHYSTSNWVFGYGARRVRMWELWCIRVAFFLMLPPGRLFNYVLFYACWWSGCFLNIGLRQETATGRNQGTEDQAEHSIVPYISLLYGLSRAFPLSGIIVTRSRYAKTVFECWWKKKNKQICSRNKNTIDAALKFHKTSEMKWVNKKKITHCLNSLSSSLTNADLNFVWSILSRCSPPCV